MVLFIKATLKFERSRAKLFLIIIKGGIQNLFFKFFVRTIFIELLKII